MLIVPRMTQHQKQTSTHPLQVAFPKCKFDIKNNKPEMQDSNLVSPKNVLEMAVSYLDFEENNRTMKDNTMLVRKSKVTMPGNKFVFRGNKVEMEENKVPNPKTGKNAVRISKP